MRRSFFLLTVLLCLACCFGSCKRRVSYTTIAIDDSLRHYTPILRGKDLHLRYKVHNTGKVPLLIEDILPSCGCIIDDNDEKDLVIPPGKFTYLQFTFNANKNTGYVEHYIRLYGNIAPKGMAVMIFDTNVVPEPDYIHDYEEIYQNQNPIDKALKNYSTGTRDTPQYHSSEDKNKYED